MISKPIGESDVDDGLAPAVERAVHEGAELGGLARRPGERTVEQVERGAERDQEAAQEP